MSHKTKRTRMSSSSPTIKKERKGFRSLPVPSVAHGKFTKRKESFRQRVCNFVLFCFGSSLSFATVFGCLLFNGESRG